MEKGNFGGSRWNFQLGFHYTSTVDYSQSWTLHGARLVHSLHFSDHISNAPANLHWLGSPVRVMFQAIHWSAPTYLSRLVRVTDLPGRHSVHSARYNRLLVPSIRLSTVGGRALPVACPAIWNNLPDTVTSSPSLSTFRQRLKTNLFSFSFSDIILYW